jgi:hypothetical protein
MLYRFVDCVQRPLWVGWMVDLANKPVGTVLDCTADSSLDIDTSLTEWC